MSPSEHQERAPVARGKRRTGCRRMAAAALALSTLALAGCGDPAPDPTAKRTDVQAEQLRERLRTGQGAT